ncbi:DUF1304 domain-containing protein [Actinokineospora xionganensis]|uniref:DUF1304 domain-containing protein n=1 Tax=Actinokineospora xionganensis TaxID=2684470 RepID=A0ABR7L263_9PSEU|nr:DUF1304 domain-containing protein [Actinokineospora xionganensis]MBC6446481.1 DUF1304 domain-containing protein [Actinokineospora xionganensis]
MDTAAKVMLGLVGLIHVYILVLEMFLWNTSLGRRTFGTSHEFAAETAMLAGNQGLYNGFLAAGLFYGLVADSLSFQVFFLVCVMIAGLYGAATVSLRILYVQTVPALIALVLVLLAR